MVGIPRAADWTSTTRLVKAGLVALERGQISGPMVQWNVSKSHGIWKKSTSIQWLGWRSIVFIIHGEF